MRGLTVADIVQHAEKFEQMLSDFYGNLSRQTAREGVRLLMDYMSRHRRRIRAEIEKLTPEHRARIWNATLNYPPDAADHRCLERVHLPKDATAKDVLDAAVAMDECLVKLYRQAAAETDDSGARDLFESLIRAEQRDEIEIKKIKAMDYF